MYSCDSSCSGKSCKKEKTIIKTPRIDFKNPSHWSVKLGNSGQHAYAKFLLHKHCLPSYQYHYSHFTLTKHGCRSDSMISENNRGKSE